MHTKLLKILFLFITIWFNTNCNPNTDKTKKDNLYLLLGLSLIASNCNVGVTAFWTIDFQTGDDKCISVTKVAEGTKVIIYEEAFLASKRSYYDVANLDYRTVLAEIENTMLPKIIAATGEPTDINGDKKFAIVFADLSSSSGYTYVAGYFNPIDLFKSPGFGIRSNEREVIYIDGLILVAQAAESAKKSRPNDYYSTIAHEFQHLVRYPFAVGKSTITAPIPYPTTYSELYTYTNTDALWINEGTSEVVSDIAGYGPQHSRLACLRSDPAYGCSRSINGRSLFDFIGRISDYSFSYAFMKFIYENSGNSLTTRNSFLNKTIRGTNSAGQGTRARGAGSLASVYGSSAEKYNSTILLTSSTDVFGRLSAAFYANFFRYPNANTTLGKFNLGADLDLSSGGNALLTTYPMPASLALLTNNPSLIPLVNNSPSVFELDQGQIYRVSGTAPILSAKTNVHLIKNSTTEYVIFNGSDTEKTGYTTASSIRNVNTDENPPIQLTKPMWSPSKIDAQAGVDPSKYIRERQIWMSRFYVQR